MSGTPPPPPANLLQSHQHLSPSSASTPLSSVPGRRRSRRACESCRTSKQRCSFLTSEGENQSSCKLCEKSGTACVVEYPAAKVSAVSQSTGTDTPASGAGNGVVGKRRRACESCRTSKAKCIFEGEDDSTCQNCERARRTCVVELDARFPKKTGDGSHPGEKRRKLERGDEMTDRSGSGPQIDSTKDKRSYGAIFPFLFTPDNRDNAAPVSSAGTSSPSVPDIIDRGLISLVQAEQCFSFFINHQSPRLPWVGFPLDPSFSKCRAQTPFVFAAIIAVGAGYDPSDLQARLIDEFYRQMADLVIYRSQKRCDIVHAILICTFWTPPPEQLEDLRYSTNVHLATSIALDVTQVGPYEAVLHIPRGEKTDSFSDEGGKIESWRIMLACFASCSMLALTLKRPSALHFNEKIEKHMGNLLNLDIPNSAIAKKDKMVGNWIRLHRIEEALAEAKDSVPSENGSGNASDMAITKRLLAASFEARLKEWKEGLSEADMKSETLMIEYHFIELQTALLAMSDTRQQLGFPFTTEQLTIPPVDIANVGKSVRASKAILGLFLSFNGSDIPSLPSIIFPRAIYSMITLVKVASTMGELYGKDRNSETVDDDVKNMNVLAYCDGLTDLLQRASGPRPGRSSKVIGLLILLKRWYTKSVLGRKEASTKQKSKKKGATGPTAAPQAQVESHSQFGTERQRDANQRNILLPQTTFNATNSLSPGSGSFQSTATPSAQESNDPIRHQVYNLPPLPPARLPTYSSSLPQSQYNSPYQISDSTTASVPNAYPDTGIYSITNTVPGKFMSPDTSMYPGGNSDYTLDGSAIGMDGIPPLNAFEESQYSFLDALLGPGSGGVPFGLVNDAMAGFGWM